MSGARIAAEVAAALREVGREAGAGTLAGTLIRPVLPAVNPWDTPGTTTSVPVALMIEAFRQDLIDGTLIRAEDRKVMMEATGPLPTTADRLLVEGVTYAILSVSPEAPGGVALYYVLHCRR